MARIRELLKSAAKPLLVVLTGILFYEVLEHLSPVRAALAAVGKVLRPLFAGVAIAYIVNIPSTIIQKHIFRNRRNKRLPIIISDVVSFLLVGGLIALIALLVIPKAAEGVRTLLSNIENYYNAAVKWASGLWEKLNLNEEAAAKASEMFGTLAQRAENFLLEAIPKLLNYTFSTVGFIANAFIAVTFSIYCLAGKNKLLAHARRFIRAVFSEEKSQRILDVCAFSNATFRGYISGQILGSAVLGIFCYIGMRIFGMPYPELISAVIAAFALIPILGPWISTIASALIILMASPDKPMLAFWFVVMIFVIQQIDNSVINPRIVGSAVGLSTVWVLLGIVVGGGLFGVRGLLLAVPVTAILYRLAADWTNERAKKKGIPIVETVPNTEYDAKRKKPASEPKRRPFFSKPGEAKAPSDGGEDPSEENKGKE